MNAGTHQIVTNVPQRFGRGRSDGTMAVDQLYRWIDGSPLAQIRAEATASKPYIVLHFPASTEAATLVQMITELEQMGLLA